MKYNQVSAILDRLPLTIESRCSYFGDRSSRSRVFQIDGGMNPDFFEIALNKGYRRCGPLYYQFNCPQCQLCQNYRVVIPDFQPTRSQKRVLRRNQDVAFDVTSPTPTVEKEAIYLRYQYHQHFLRSRGSFQYRDQFDPEDQLSTMYYQMYSNPLISREIEFRLDDRLIGFGIIDVAKCSVSAVYFVFDPDYGSRSLGSLAILKGIEWAAREDFVYYHLGFYIADHPKMNYKKKFRRSEIRDRSTGDWIGME